ncbi:hypothetical protein HDU76_007652, partial [Blyttiomyces sp. JEL0837]
MLHIWDRRDKVVVSHSMGFQSTVTALSVNIDETSLVLASNGGEVKVFSLKTNHTTNLKSPFKQCINHAAFSPFKKSLIAVAGDDGGIAVWDVNLVVGNASGGGGGEPLFVIYEAHMAPIYGMAWSPCHKSFIVSAGLDRRVKVFNKDEKGKLMHEFETDSPVTSLSVNDDFVVAAGMLSGCVQIFDIRVKRLMMTIVASDTSGVTSLAFEPPGWAKENSSRDAGANANTVPSRGDFLTHSSTGVHHGSNLSQSHVSVHGQGQSHGSASGSPVVAALKERMAAVKEKQNIMEMFSPVKAVNAERFAALDARVKDLRKAGAAKSGLRSEVLGAGSNDAGAVGISGDEKTAGGVVRKSSLTSLKMQDSVLDMFSPVGQHTRIGFQSAMDNNRPSSPSSPTPFQSAKGDRLESSSAETLTHGFRSKLGQTSSSSASASALARMQDAMQALRGGKSGSLDSSSTGGSGSGSGFGGFNSMGMVKSVESLGGNGSRGAFSREVLEKEEPTRDGDHRHVGGARGEGDVSDRAFLSRGKSEAGRVGAGGVE